VRAFYSDTFVLPLPDGHRFPMAKYRKLRDRCLHEGRGEGIDIQLAEARAATDGELALAHEVRYIDAVAHGHLSAAEQREIGFPWSPAMAERARRSVGATLDAAQAALMDGDGVSASLAGGTHHAYANKGSGFCVFNDVAVGARLMQSRWHRAHRQFLRVAVIDLDVHQGNGTAAIFRDDPSVYTLSMHGARNFPFRKKPSSHDVELPDGCDDAMYLSALDTALDALWAHHALHAGSPPGLVFFLAGADPHEGDRLGRLNLTLDGLRQRDERVLQACAERRIPVVMMMAGGYGRDIDVTVDVHWRSLQTAARFQQRWGLQVGARAVRA
jgi:acetoin utilization deacetylase AcuC-like enzyme